jgi:hypothetical protein
VMAIGIACLVATLSLLLWCLWALGRMDDH